MHSKFEAIAASIMWLISFLLIVAVLNVCKNSMSLGSKIVLVIVEVMAGMIGYVGIKFSY
jgi:hypothetical protein